jgi:Amt family ammonium transporter
MDEAAQIAQLTAAIDVGWIIFAGCLVFLMQAGFTLLEAGYVRTKNTQSILMKNVMDCATGALGWFAMGYGLAYGEDSKDAEEGGGFIGTDHFFVRNKDLKKDGTGVGFANFFFQWTFCATAATIVAGSMAERCHLEGYILVSLSLSVLLYPVVVHWTWGGGWLAEKGYNDFAGSGVVHMFGGIVALVGAKILGPRLGRFDPATMEEVKKPSSMLNICLGTLMLWFCWFAFNAGSTLGLSGGNSLTAGRCCATTMLSAASGGLTGFIIASKREKKFDIGAFTNGILGGLVGITAGCANIDLHLAVLIGFIAGIIVDLATALLEKLQIDDPVGAFPVHGACGIWGVIAAGLFDLDKGWFTTSTNFNDSLGPQLLGILAIAAWASCCTAPLFLFLNKIGMLHVGEGMEERGLDNEFVAGVSRPTVAYNPKQFNLIVIDEEKSTDAASKNSS